MHTYKPPQLSGHKVLYKGKRFWVFEVSNKFPYEGNEEFSDLVIFDKSDEVYNGVVAYGTKDQDGKYIGKTPYGQNELSFEGYTFQELIQNYIATEKMIISYER